MCAVPLGETAVCQAGTSLTQPQSNVDRAAVVEADDVLDAVAVDLGRELDDREHLRAGALGDVDRVAHVVAVPVGQRDHVRRQLVGGRGGLRVAGQERVDQHVRAASGEVERGVPEPAYVAAIRSPRGRSSSWASSKPTATPISIATRVSSASSCRTACRRSSMSALPAASSTCCWCAVSNQFASSSAWLRIRCSAGAFASTTRWACVEPVRVGERLQRRRRPRHRCSRGVRPLGAIIRTRWPCLSPPCQPRRRLRLQALRRRPAPDRRRAAPSDRPARARRRPTRPTTRASCS